MRFILRMKAFLHVHSMGSLPVGNGHALAREGRQGILQLANEVQSEAGAKSKDFQVPLPHASGEGFLAHSDGWAWRNSS